MRTIHKKACIFSNDPSSGLSLVAFFCYVFSNITASWMATLGKDAERSFHHLAALRFIV